MRRSRGGLTTEIHALVDANGLPVALKLTEGQAHDGRSANGMLDGLAAGQVLLADRASFPNEPGVTALMDVPLAWRRSTALTKGF